MYKRIMVPVDLAHADRLDKAITTAADLAKHYGSDLVFVGVTGTEPGPVARTPEEFARKLEAFAAETATRLGTTARAETIRLHDVTIDLNRALERHGEETGADLIVMASHVPGAAEYIFGSHAGEVAQHARMSVFVVRGA